MIFVNCPFCNKFVVVSQFPPDTLHKALCKKCFKVFYVQPLKHDYRIYKEEEVIVNRMNNTVMLKKTIDKVIIPRLKKGFHDVNKKLTENEQKKKEALHGTT